MFFSAREEVLSGGETLDDFPARLPVGKSLDAPGFRVPSRQTPAFFGMELLAGLESQDLFIPTSTQPLSRRPSQRQALVISALFSN